MNGEKGENDYFQMMREIAEQPAPPGFAKGSAGLGAFPLTERLVMGRVHGVNDEGARLVSAFIPTVYELEILAHHYLEVVNTSTSWAPTRGRAVATSSASGRLPSYGLQRSPRRWARELSTTGPAPKENRHEDTVET